MARFARANNEKAHTEVLKSELQIVSQALSVITNQISSLKQEQSNLKSGSALIREENERTKLDTERRLKEVYDKEKALESKEQEVQAYFDDKESKSKGLEQDARNKVLKLKETESLFRATIYDQEQDIIYNAGRILEQENQIKNSILTLEEIRVKIQSLGSEFRNLKQQRDKELGDIHKQIVVSSQELIDTRLLIEDEKTKISKPMELLRRANEEINRRKSDLDIFKTQLDNHWEDILRRKNK